MKTFLIKKLINTLFFALILSSTTTALAVLYKGFDAEGNVSYSDKPFANSEKMKMPEISVVVTSPPKPKVVEPKNTEKADEKNKATQYKRLDITSPKHQETFWNSDKLAVSLSLSPSLNTTAGDHLSLRLDGQTIIKSTTKLSHEITILDRGEHKLQAVVRNKQGKIVKQSKVVTVYIKRAVIRQQAR